MGLGGICVFFLDVLSLRKGTVCLHQFLHKLMSTLLFTLASLGGIKVHV